MGMQSRRRRKGVLQRTHLDACNRRQIIDGDRIGIVGVNPFFDALDLPSGCVIGPPIVSLGVV